MRDCGGTGQPPSDNFSKSRVNQTYYISLERGSFGDHDSFEVSEKFLVSRSYKRFRKNGWI